MLDVQQQLAQGRLVCPVSHAPLHRARDVLAAADGLHAYPIEAGVPILIADPTRQAEYRNEADGRMYEEYLTRERASWPTDLLQSLVRPKSDYRSLGARKAFLAVTADQPAGSLSLSVGGGPGRPHEMLVNLNIDLFPNVDVVADAYALPYADGSVDSIHCEAVLEHLAEPRKAAEEMFRVLKPGGLGYFATPFLQGYHAYPNHYQNFTLTGHDYLLERAGFKIVDSGTCVGPTYMILDLLSTYFHAFIPSRRLAQAASAAVTLTTKPLRLADRRLNRSSASHILASTVYALAERP